MKQLTIFAFATLSTILTGCDTTGSIGTALTHKPYRLGEKTVIEIGQDEGRSSLKLGFLEFDDQGEAWQEEGKAGEPKGRSQLVRVLDSLDGELKKGPVKVIIFLHGWNNDASPANEEKGNLGNFKKALGSLPNAPGERMFGIYVAWRGKSYPWPTYLDVGTREGSAARVGGAPLLSAIQAISTKVQRSPRSRVIAVGHSFGAKILGQITSQSLAMQLGQIKGGAKEVRPMIDTVILANTAENAAIPRKMINLVRETPITYRNPANGRQLPLVVVVSSESDWLVERGIPAWNVVSRNILGFPSKGGATSSRDQKRSLYRAMGYDPALVSHKLYRTNEIYPCQALNPTNPGALTAINVRLGAKPPLKEDVHTLRVSLFPDRTRCQPEIYEVREDPRPAASKGLSRNETPFWIFQVPSHVIKGHGDIWNQNFVGLVMAIDSMSRLPGNPQKMGRAPKMKGRAR
ncbi:hypothetical protein V2O64_16435 [Verrucomicrobiaceae bacterium 227]